MPPDDPGSLSSREYADLIAYVLSVNEFPVGQNKLSRDRRNAERDLIEAKRVNIAWNHRQRRWSMRLANGSRMLGSAKQNMVVRVAGESLTREAVFEGWPLEVKL